MSHQIAFYVEQRYNATLPIYSNNWANCRYRSYLNRKTEESTKLPTKTVHSKIKALVAAPTAGLHFTQDVLDKIAAKSIEREEITLHAGAGTFKPVKLLLSVSTKCIPNFFNT